MDFSLLVFVALFCYTIGSIPTAYLAARFIKGVDIRTIGSGNVGASNASRVLGRTWGILVMAFDALKGLVPVLLIQHLWFRNLPSAQTYAIVGAVFCLVGHIYPVWLKFKGGKGVATGLGVMIALVPVAVAVAVPVFILVVFLTRMISVGSMSAALALPAAFFIDHDLLNHRGLFIFTLGACLFVIYKHKSNIKRIIQGVENRLGDKNTHNQEE
ncbi:MAG TPA: glycerol-3-phosphate 1-O-acyltransferase PlsY [Turneriella sp.]|nr:glycerol-3-phosphate 1-O-acyltransferase PlsY [Turneriella sp.]